MLLIDHDCVLEIISNILGERVKVPVPLTGPFNSVRWLCSHMLAGGRSRLHRRRRRIGCTPSFAFVMLCQPISCNDCLRGCARRCSRYSAPAPPAVVLAVARSSALPLYVLFRRLCRHFEPVSASRLLLPLPGPLPNAGANERVEKERSLWTCSIQDVLEN